MHISTPTLGAECDCKMCSIHAQLHVPITHPGRVLRRARHIRSARAPSCWGRSGSGLGNRQRHLHHDLQTKRGLIQATLSSVNFLKWAQTSVVTTGSCWWMKSTILSPLR